MARAGTHRCDAAWPQVLLAHGHLVLVAAGLTAFPTEPRRARAAARVQVTVAPWHWQPWVGGVGGRVSSWLRTLGVLTIPRYRLLALTPAALLGEPQWRGHTRGTGVPRVPGRRVALPTLGVAFGTLGWSTGAWVAALAGLGSPSWGRSCSAALPSPPKSTFLQPWSHEAPPTQSPAPPTGPHPQQALPLSP